MSRCRIPPHPPYGCILRGADEIVKTLTIAAAQSATIRPMRTAVYPGSFDPLTNGHLDIIRRGTRLFDRFVVAVLENEGKSPLFSVAERKELIARCTADMPGVKVQSFSGLLI